MGLSDYPLGADLSQLNMIGKVDLPMLAYVYAGLNNVVANSADDVVAFATPAGCDDRVGPAWTDLRNQLQNILGHTSTALDKTAGTILHIVEAYRVTDDLARQSVDNAWANGSPPSDMRQDTTEIVPPGPADPVIIAGEGN